MFATKRKCCYFSKATQEQYFQKLWWRWTACSTPIQTISQFETDQPSNQPIWPNRHNHHHHHHRSETYKSVVVEWNSWYYNGYGLSKWIVGWRTGWLTEWLTHWQSLLNDWLAGTTGNLFVFLFYGKAGNSDSVATNCICCIIWERGQRKRDSDTTRWMLWKAVLGKEKILKVL